MKVPKLFTSFFVLSLLLVLTVCLGSSQAVTQEWVARYDSSTGGDYAKDIVVDSAGNVIVTGSAGGMDSQYVTVKYNSAGVEQWVRTYNGPVANGDDGAEAIAVDGSDNIYVTGYSLQNSATTKRDIVTIKYDSAGTVAAGWPKIYDSGHQANDQGNDIVVDSSGNVYVTGLGDIAGLGNADCVTIKYNSAGTLQWEDGFSTKYAGMALALNSTATKLYVCGATLLGSKGYDYLILEYNTATGVLAGSISYNGTGVLPNSNDDFAEDIAVDAAGNFYVTGESSGGNIPGDKDCVTIKFGTAGAIAAGWPKRYDTVNGPDRGTALVLDGSANVYVTGSSTNLAGNADYLTIMYDTAGTQQWLGIYDGGMDDYANDIAMDNLGNTYVTGESKKVSGNDYVTVMYTAAGVQQWSIGYDASGGWDNAQAIAVYDSNNIYVTGDSVDAVGNRDYATVKYSQAASGGSIIKWEQLPDTNETGIDIRCDRSDGVLRTVADDFECNSTGLITDVRFWGSWKDDPEPAGRAIQTIHLSIHEDIPASESSTGYSMPGALLWEKDFIAADFNESLYATVANGEWWWDPYTQVLQEAGDNQIWQYDIDIDPADAFRQEGTPGNPVVYWLDIYVVLDDRYPSTKFGWKTRKWPQHYNDDAVFDNDGWMELRYPQEHPYYEAEPNSIDMAFVITTGEPPKWEQKPDLSVFGIDVDATVPLILADDFNCTKTELITDITVWGSWKDDVLPDGFAGNVKFTLSIHEDIPDPEPLNPETHSMPGEVKWVYTFEPGTFGVSIEAEEIEEGWWSPDKPGSYSFPGDTVCWKYTFQIPPELAFCQKGTPEAPIVYWLDVQAEPLDQTGEAKFGWKSSLEHWNDDAVWGQGQEPYSGPWNELRYPTEHEYQGQSIDLAFAIDGNLPCPEPVSDLGDAPDSTNSFGGLMTAYPGPGIIAGFPTVYGIGSPPYGPLHQLPSTAFYLGRSVTLENEADIGPDQDGINNLNVLMDTPDLDLADNGVAIPLLLPRCRMVTFDYIVTVIDPAQPIYANVWFDWNRDGDWDDTATCDLGKPADEWAVQDQPLAFATASTYTVTTPPFRAYYDFDSDLPDIWMRITLSETPWTPSASGGSGPAAGYQYGETEDYYFIPDMSCSSCADFDLDGVIDWLDLRELTSNWLWISSGDFREADLDCDGDIQFDDFATLAKQWMLSCP